MSLESIPWQLLTILSGTLTGVSLIFNKHQTAKGSALQTRGYYYFFSAILIGGFWLLTSGNVPQNWWLYYGYGMAVAALTVIYSIAQRISMSQTSLVEPVGQLLGIITATIVLAEWQLFTTSQGIKFILALILMPLLFWLLYQKSLQGKKWLQMALIYVVALALFKVTVKILLTTVGAAAEMLFFQYLGSATIAYLGVKFKKQNLFISKRFATQGLIQAITGSSSILFLYTALKLTTVTQTTLIRTPLVLLIATVSGLIGFKEAKQMTLKKWLGVGVALVIIFLVLTSE